jgi:hypothetical protein
MSWFHETCRYRLKGLQTNRKMNADFQPKRYHSFFEQFSVAPKSHIFILDRQPFRILTRAFHGFSQFYRKCLDTEMESIWGPPVHPSLSSHIYHHHHHYYYYYYYGMAAQFPALAPSIFSSQIIRLNVFSHNSRLYNFENEMGGECNKHNKDVKYT